MAEHVITSMSAPGVLACGAGARAIAAQVRASFQKP
jgi:hypothetical protein